MFQGSSAGFSSWQRLAADRVHGRLVDGAMKFAGPAVMTIVLMTAKSVDDDIGTARSKAQGRLRAGLFATERETPFRLQALDQEFHGGR